MMNTQEEIIEINKKQVEFYNYKSDKKNLPTKIWYYFREKTLKKIPEDALLVIDGSNTQELDYDILELINEYIF